MDESPQQPRKFPRVALGSGVEVFDPESGAKLGDLVDLSPEGTLIFSPRPFEIGTTRWFELQIADVDPIEAPRFQAVCRWTQLKVTPQACVNASGWAFTGEVSLATKASLVQALAKELARASDRR